MFILLLSDVVWKNVFISGFCRARIEEEKVREKLERQIQEGEKFKMHKEALEKEIEVMRGEIDRAETSKAKVLYESEKNSMEMEKIVYDNKQLKEKYNQAKDEIQYSQNTLARMEAELEQAKHDLQKTEMNLDRANTSKKYHDTEVSRLEQELDAWRDKYHQSEQDVVNAEESLEEVKKENQRLKYQFQDQENTKERLLAAGADYERQEEKFAGEIDRLQEKLSKLKYSEETARTEKEKSELEVMRLSRELERLQYQVGGSSRDQSANLKFQRLKNYIHLQKCIKGPLGLIVLLECIPILIGR